MTIDLYLHIVEVLLVHPGVPSWHQRLGKALRHLAHSLVEVLLVPDLLLFHLAAGAAVAEDSNLVVEVVVVVDHLDPIYCCHSKKEKKFMDVSTSFNLQS